MAYQGVDKNLEETRSSKPDEVGLKNFKGNRRINIIRVDTPGINHDAPLTGGRTNNSINGPQTVLLIP